MVNNMFVHYSGTIAAFKAAGNEATYEKSIVFISGDVEGKGAAIYTHNKYFGSIAEALSSLTYFSSISDGTTTATASGPNGTIIFSGDDNSTVKVQAGSTGIKIGISDTVMNAIAAKAEASAVNAIDGRLQTVEGDYLKGSDKEALEGKVSQALIDAKAYTDSEVERIVADSGSGLIGSADDTADDNTIYGAKKYAAEAATAAQNAAATDATSKVDAAKAEIKNTTDALDGRIATIEDDYLKSSDKTDVINAGKVSIAEAAGTGNVLKTYTFTQNGETIGTINLAKDLVVSGGEVIEKEGVKYLSLTIANQESPVEIPVTDLVDVYVGSTYIAISESNEISVKFADLDAALVAETTAVGAAIKAADNKGAKGISDAAAAKSAADAAQITADANAGRLATIEGDYLKKADKDALQGSIDAVSAVANAAAPQATTYTKSEVDGLVNGVDAKFANYYLKSETYTKAEIEAFWAWEEL